MNKTGEVLTENIIFIILNLVFITILILFVASNSGEGAFLEEKYAKQIALLIDSAKPGMEIVINVEDALKEAKRNKVEGRIITVDNDRNEISVNLKGKQGYRYSFFNNVDVSVNPDASIKNYAILVNEYKNE
jgi:hypothetical protein